MSLRHSLQLTCCLLLGAGGVRAWTAPVEGQDAAPARSVALGGSDVPSSANVAPEDGPPRLSLRAALAEALERNDRLIDQQGNTQRAWLALKLARAEFHPKLVPNVLGSFGQTDVSNQTYRLDAVQRLTTGTELRASVGTSSAQNQIGSFYNTDTTFQLSQPLLRGFGPRVARRGLASAEAQVAEAARQRVLVEQQVALEVASAYHRLVAQTHLLEVSEQGLARARRLVEASTAKMEIGKVSQLDVYRAQQLAAQAEAQLLDARGAVEDAREQLRFLMGRGPESAFEVERDVPLAGEPPAPERAAELALERRLELDGARAAIEDADRAASFARNQLLPQLDLNLALTRRETAESFSDSFRFDHFRFATFFAISLPSDRTAQSIELQTALIERGRRRRELDTLRRRIADEARRAVRQQVRLAKGLELADASVAFAEKELEVANIRYQRGLSDNLDVVNAEQGLLQAQSRRLAARAEAATADLALRATLGILDPWAFVRADADARMPAGDAAGPQPASRAPQQEDD